MKNKLTLIASSALLLAACGINEATGSSSVASPSSSTSEAISSSLSESSSSSSTSSESFYIDPEAEGKKAKVTAFIESLSNYEGSVQSVSFVSSLENGYMVAESDYLTTGATSKGVKTRYGSSSSGQILIEAGNQSYSDDGDPIAYTRQLFRDSNYFYSITEYVEKDEQGDEAKTYSKEVATYKIGQGMDNKYFNISFYNNQRQILEDFHDYIGEKNIVTEMSFPEIAGDGNYNMSYSAASIDSDGLPVKKITYTIKFSIVSNVVSSSTLSLATDIYVGKTIGNYLHSEITNNYTQGDFASSTYSGTIFDPSKINS